MRRLARRNDRGVANIWCERGEMTAAPGQLSTHNRRWSLHSASGRLEECVGYQGAAATARLLLEVRNNNTKGETHAQSALGPSVGRRQCFRRCGVLGVQCCLNGQPP